MTRATPAIIVHSADHAVAALTAAKEAGVAVVLASAPGAGIYGGAGWFAALVAAAADAVPGARSEAVLDCGDAPGAVLAALRAGIGRVRFTGPKRAGDRLAAIAKESGATVDRKALPGLDLARESDPLAACRAFLAGPSRTRVTKAKPRAARNRSAAN